MTTKKLKNLTAMEHRILSLFFCLRLLVFPLDFLTHTHTHTQQKNRTDGLIVTRDYRV